MMTKQEKNNIEKFINHFVRLTVRILHWDSERKLTGRSSGFLYQPDTKLLPLIITAGHGTPKQGAFIETPIIKNGQTLSLNGGEFKVFYHHDNFDYAYSKLPLDTIQQDLEKGTEIEFTAYRHKFIKAKKNEAYGFAVVNNYEFVKTDDGLILPTYCCYEIGLELIKQDEHINYFKTARPIQDHEYYQGASGSPIADPEGAITSILIGGTDPKEFLRAFRLDNINLKLNNGC